MGPTAPPCGALHQANHLGDRNVLAVGPPKAEPHKGSQAARGGVLGGLIVYVVPTHF